MNVLELGFLGFVTALLGFSDPITLPSGRNQIARCPLEPQLIGIRLEKRGAGIEVVDLSSDGAYFQLGLRAGDVVTRLDGERANQPIHILRMFALKDGDTIMASRLGSSIKFTFSKSLVTDVDGLPKEGCLTLGLMPISEGGFTGLWVRMLNPLGLFSRTNLRVGDLIVSVNGKRIHRETKQVVLELEAGDEVEVIRANDIGSYSIQVPTQENPNFQINRPDRLENFKTSIREGNFKVLMLQVEAQ